MSPEALEGRFSAASDVWAYGVVVWELASGAKPFAELSGAQAAVAIARGTRLPRPSDGGGVVSDALWLVVTRCWKLEVADRPTSEQLVKQIAAILADDARNQDEE